MRQTLTSDAARVTVRRHRPVVVDGPFTEAKEMVGGFFLLQALEIARKCLASS